MQLTKIYSMASGRKFPHTYVIIFYIIILAAVLTWLIPGGEFQRIKVEAGGTEREVIQGNTFKYTGNQPQTWQVFSAIFEGFVDKADIIVFILIIGGAFWIMNQTQSIDVGIYTFLRKARKLEHIRLVKSLGVDNIVITLIILLFSIFGATFGMSEETIAFTIIFVPMAVSMGYDSITGVAMSFVAAALGFAGAMLNPFTIGIAQGLSHLPLFSGLEYRFFCWIIINLAGVSYILWYMRRIRRKPTLSPVYEEDEYWRTMHQESNTRVEYHTPKPAWYVFVALSVVFIWYAFSLPVTEMKIGLSAFTLPVMPFLAAVFILTGFIALLKSVHFFILNLLAFTILLLIVGVMGYDWYIMEIATLFMALGIFSGISMGYGPNNITRLFLDGVRDILSAALVVGLAGGIIIILTKGQIVDTLLYYASRAMEGMGKIGTVGVMYVIQTGINIIIPSGSAKAALTIPIMSQFSDLVGLSRQATVMAFQFGDGFTNMITPTSGVLIGVLGVARVPFSKWLKWITPLMIILIILGFLLLIPTVTMELNGF
jgi:uncharacterized ion transporter superfamily protein YfcC